MTFADRKNITVYHFVDTYFIFTIRQDLPAHTVSVLVLLVIFLRLPLKAATKLKINFK